MEVGMETGGGGGPKGNNPANELSDPVIIART